MNTQELIIDKDLQNSCSLVAPAENTEFTITLKELVQKVEFVNVQFDFLCKIKKVKKKPIVLFLILENNEYSYQIMDGQMNFSLSLRKGLEVSGRVLVDGKKNFAIKKFIVQ